MLLDEVLRKSSALLAAMLTMAAAWCCFHLPGAHLPMVAFAFLSASALCDISRFNLRMRRCFALIGGAAATQIALGTVSNHPLVQLPVAMIFSYIILSCMADRQAAIIVLLTAFLSLQSPPGLTAALERSMDMLVSGITVLLITTVCNLFAPDIAGESYQPQPYSPRQSAIITAELACGFIIFLLLKHEQAVWIMLTILFIHMAENPRAPLPGLVKRRIAATPIGILLGGAYLAAFGSFNYRASYIVPLTGTLGFFMLYLKNDYFLFTLLFMFTLTVFSDWMLGSYHRFHFTEILFVRSLATVIGGILLLCGKDIMEKEAV